MGISNVEFIRSKTLSLSEVMEGIFTREGNKKI